MSTDRLVLSNFEGPENVVVAGAQWRGFSDRVMGGVSDAEFGIAEVAGKRCIRLTGRVTRDSGGGFIQIALDLGSRMKAFDGSAYAGVEFLVYGNDEDYNCHVRTADCGWYDESYRATVRVGSRWQSIRIPWTGFTPQRRPACAQRQPPAPHCAAWLDWLHGWRSVHSNGVPH